MEGRTARRIKHIYSSTSTSMLLLQVYQNEHTPPTSRSGSLHQLPLAEGNTHTQQHRGHKQPQQSTYFIIQLCFFIFLPSASSLPIHSQALPSLDTTNTSTIACACASPRKSMSTHSTKPHLATNAHDTGTDHSQNAQAIRQ